MTHSFISIQTPEPPSEAAPNSTSSSDPLLVNGKKLSFTEPRRNSLKLREDGSVRTFRDTSKQLHEEEDAALQDLSAEGADRKEPNANREHVLSDEVDEEEKSKAPKLSTVLRNFRPPSLAKFVPKSKSSSNTGCDV